MLALDGFTTQVPACLPSSHACANVWERTTAPCAYVSSFLLRSLVYHTLSYFCPTYPGWILPLPPRFCVHLWPAAPCCCRALCATNCRRRCQCEARAPARRQRQRRDRPEGTCLCSSGSSSNSHTAITSEDQRGACVRLVPRPCRARPGHDVEHDCGGAG